MIEVNNRVVTKQLLGSSIYLVSTYRQYSWSALPYLIHGDDQNPEVKIGIGQPNLRKRDVYLIPGWKGLIDKMVEGALFSKGID